MKQFLCSRPRKDADIIIVGFPFEETVSFRGGTGAGPRAFRHRAEEAIEEYSMRNRCSLSDIPFHDSGDTELPAHNIPRSLKIMEDTAATVFREKKTLLSLGGEHLITLPILRALLPHSSNLHMIQCDAHADLRKTYDGQTYSHATVMHHCLESGLHHLHQTGIRSCTDEEHDRMGNDSRITAHEKPANIATHLPAGCDIYLSIDVDYFDPSRVPGTGTPEAGGATMDDMLTMLHTLTMSDCTVRGIDITELAPDIDPTGRSAVFAQKLLREVLTSGICSCSHIL